MKNTKKKVSGRKISIYTDEDSRVSLEMVKKIMEMMRLEDIQDIQIFTSNLILRRLGKKV